MRREAARLIDLHDQKKSREGAARYWRELGRRTKEDSLLRERCYQFECANARLARVSELDIQAKLAEVSL